MDTHEIQMHPCYLNIHKLGTFIHDEHYNHVSWNIYICRILHELETL